MKIYKIKTEHVVTLQKWGKELMNELYAEASETLVEENCVREFCHIFEISASHYAVFYMEPNENSNIIPSNISKKINQKHKEIMNVCIDYRIKTNEIYHIKAK